MRTLRILIADGFVDFLDMMEQLLRARGHEPLAASTMQGALDACALSPPEVVLFDPQLVGDVAAFVAAARKHMPAGARIVALVRDGEADGSLVDGTLRKPFHLADLFALLDAWFT